MVKIDTYIRLFFPLKVEFSGLHWNYRLWPQYCCHIVGVVMIAVGMLSMTMMIITIDDDQNESTIIRHCRRRRRRQATDAWYHAVVYNEDDGSGDDDVLRGAEDRKFRISWPSFLLFFKTFFLQRPIRRLIGSKRIFYGSNWFWELTFVLIVCMQNYLFF